MISISKKAALLLFVFLTASLHINAQKNIASKDTLFLLSENILKDFDFIMKQKNVEVKTLFSYENGTLILNTNEVGYFLTKQSFKNYSLHVEWKWNQNAAGANSGILIHVQEPDTVWPKCIQAQLKQEKAGDIIAMAGAKSKETEGKPKDTAEKYEASNEKIPGDWNAYDIVCEDETLTVYVNGVLQNKITQMNISEGKIGFQLEGKPVSFKNIYLVHK